jgi:Flp pilus assembly pilin Flp
MKIIKNKKKGQGLVEYAFLIALIALALLAILTSTGETVNESLYGVISTNLDKANTKVQDSL